MHVKWSTVGRYYNDSINTQKEKFLKQGQETFALLLYWHGKRLVHKLVTSRAGLHAEEVLVKSDEWKDIYKAANTSESQPFIITLIMNRSTCGDNPNVPKEDNGKNCTKLMIDSIQKAAVQISNSHVFLMLCTGIYDGASSTCGKNSTTNFGLDDLISEGWLVARLDTGIESKSDNGFVLEDALKKIYSSLPHPAAAGMAAGEIKSLDQLGY